MADNTVVSGADHDEEDAMVQLLSYYWTRRMLLMQLTGERGVSSNPMCQPLLLLYSYWL